MPSRRRPKLPKLSLRALPGFQGDIDALPDLATRKMALDMLVLVRDGKIRGRPLDDHVGTGDLRDCYKLYFDPDGSDKPRFRLVFIGSAPMRSLPWRWKRLPWAAERTSTPTAAQLPTSIGRD